MSKLIAAHTNGGIEYPGYINFTRQDDGTVTVLLRGNPSKADGAYICGYAHEKGQHGRCTPGDDRCNNYCNMAPQKGPMQDHPVNCSHVREGVTTSLTLSKDDFRKFVIEALSVMSA